MKKQNRRSKKSSLGVPAAGDDVEQHNANRTRYLEAENEALKREIEELTDKLASAGIPHRGEDYPQRSSARKEQAMNLKSKPDAHSLRSIQKHGSESPAKEFNNDVQKLKAQKVKLQCKIKLDSVHFRLRKASLEKEILQLKKEQRKKEFEMRVLLALNRRQNLILQRKKTQDIAAVKQIKLLLEFGKISSDKNNSKAAGPGKGNNARIQDTKTEIELTMRLHELHTDYERQMNEIAEEIKSFRLEADMLKADLVNEEYSCPESGESLVIHTPIDSELKELKEEFSKLSTLVSQMEMTKLQLSEPGSRQSNSVKCSDSTGNNNKDQPNLESSPSENSQPPPPEPSQETVSTTKESKAEVCCSCTKRASCKTQKCECRTKGSSCGESCGCSASKCANREAVAKSNEAVESVKSVESATCPQGAQKPPELSRHDKEVFKRPLRDIGNTVVNSYEGKGKAGRRKKDLKPVDQK